MSIETYILLKFVCDTLIPKLVNEDITLFNSLLIGVYPYSKIEELREEELQKKNRRFYVKYVIYYQKRNL